MLAPLSQRYTPRPQGPGPEGGLRAAGRRGALACVTLFLCLLPWPSAPAARAAGPAAAAGDEGAEPDTPRRTVDRFLSLSRAGRYAEAARELDLGGTPPDKAPQLARQLREVLDHQLALDPDKLSDAPGGDARDGLSEDAEEIGRVPGPSGREPVRLQRLGQGPGADWVFSRQTLRRVPGWYARLPDRWLREHLPEPLLRGGPRGLLYWQWLALPALLLVSFLLSFLGVRLLRLAIEPVVRRTRWRWDDLLVEGLPGPGRLVVTALLGKLGAALLYLSGPGAELVSSVLSTLLFVGVFWGAWRAVNVLGDAARTSAWIRTHPSALGVLPLGERLAHLTLLALGLVFTLHQLGYQITSLLAGLGIGGLGVALAAQKTVEHLFGGVTLSTDQPMRVGDFVKIDSILGTVEHIGLRSTRIRTLDRTIITIPNGKLADMNIETFAARDRMRLALTLGLVYGTSAAQVRAILADIEAMLRGNEHIWEEDVVVRLLALGQSSLEVEIMCWFRTVDMREFRALRQDALLRMLEIVEAHGSQVAFPSKTVYVRQEPGSPGVPGRGP